MAALHPLNLSSLVDAEALPVVFGFSAYDLEINRTLHLSRYQRFSPTVRLLPFALVTLMALWLVNAGFAALQLVAIEIEFLQILTPAATFMVLVARFWDPLCKAALLPWSELRMVEGVLHKRIDVEQDTGVCIVRYYCMIGGETLSLSELQYFALRADVAYRAYVAYPLRRIVSIETVTP